MNRRSRVVGPSAPTCGPWCAGLRAALRTTILSVFSVGVCVALTGCASTSVESHGHALPHALCTSESDTMGLTVAWTTRWRPDQKEPSDRAAAALRGIERYVHAMSCFRETAIRIIKVQADPATLSAAEVLARLKGDRSDRVVLVVVRELGPHLRIGLPQVIAGGTEVQLDVRVIDRQTATEIAGGQVRWQRGGPFYLRGTGQLDQDLGQALAAALGSPTSRSGAPAPVHQLAPVPTTRPSHLPPPP